MKFHIQHIHILMRILNDLDYELGATIVQIIRKHDFFLVFFMYFSKSEDLMHETLLLRFTVLIRILNGSERELWANESAKNQIYSISAIHIFFKIYEDL